MCNFAWLGGSGGPENQSVSGVATICLMQCNTPPSHRVDQVVDCSLWNVGPLLFNGCAKFAGYWQELEHAGVYTNPEHPKHAQWVTCPVSMLAMQELGCFQLPGIVYIALQPGANPQCWHQQTTHPYDTTHTVCHLPRTVKTGIHVWREHLSNVSDAFEYEHFPTQVSYVDTLQSGWDPDEDNEPADELPWHSFWQFVQKFFGYANRLLQQLEVYMLDVEVLGWCGYTWSAVVRPVGCTAKLSKRLWRQLMVEKWTFNSQATALVYIPTVSMPTARSLKTCDICSVWFQSGLFLWPA